MKAIGFRIRQGLIWKRFNDLVKILKYYCKYSVNLSLNAFFSRFKRKLIDKSFGFMYNYKVDARVYLLLYFRTCANLRRSFFNLLKKGQVILWVVFLVQ